MSTIRQALASLPDAPCLIQDPHVATGREILELADSLSSLLQKRSVSSVLSLANDARYLLALLAIVDEHPLHLVLGRDNEALAQAETCISIDAFLDSEGNWKWLSPARGPAAQESGIFLFTSGTTGKPKLVHHHWRSLVEGVANRSLTKNQGARWLLPYQAHSFAALQVILSALLSNGVLVFPTRRDPKAYAQAVTDYAITHISATPTFWRAFLLATPAGQTYPSLAQITSGGEAIDQATLDRIKMAVPQARLSHIYASSEAGTLFSVNDGQAGFPAQWLDQELRGGIRLRIRGGILEVLTPRRMRAYASGQSTPLSDDGWLITGDLVDRRGDRVLFCGRMDQTINVGGLKVSPEEVEEFLLTHIAVREAKVRAIASPLTGQLVGAEVVLDPSADAQSALADLQTYYTAHLPAHKRPRRLVAVPHIAISESGKKA